MLKPPPELLYLPSANISTDAAASAYRHYLAAMTAPDMIAVAPPRAFSRL